WMRRHQTQVNARHLPEEPRPNKHPEIPAEQQELKNRQAQVAKPDPRERELRTLSRWCRVPCGRLDCNVVTPNDEDANDVHEDENQYLSEHGVTQPKYRRDGRTEAFHGVFGYQVALQELLYDETHTAVHDKLGGNQERHRHQEAGVNFDV